MSEPLPATQYTTDKPAVTLTVPAEWAEFLTRAQAARNEWRKYRGVASIAVVDWRNLSIRFVTLDDKV